MCFSIMFWQVCNTHIYLPFPTNRGFRTTLQEMNFKNIILIHSSNILFVEILGIVSYPVSCSLFRNCRFDRCFQWFQRAPYFSLDCSIEYTCYILFSSKWTYIDVHTIFVFNCHMNQCLMLTNDFVNKIGPKIDR